MDQLVIKIKNYLKKDIAVFVLISFVSLVIAYSLSNTEDPKVSSYKKSISVDTYIPQGFVLIPIEISNVETLDSLLDTHGVVNLYAVTANEYGKTSIKSERPVARRIKIIRSPKNPIKFAVLAPESQSAKIVKSQGPFYVTIQNPNSDHLEFKKKVKRKRRIIVDNY